MVLKGRRGYRETGKTRKAVKKRLWLKKKKGSSKEKKKRLGEQTELGRSNKTPKKRKHLDKHQKEKDSIS